MMQNLVTLNLSETQLQAVDAALTELEAQLVDLVALTSDVRKRARPMGDKSEAFCRQALHLMVENPQVIPPNVDVAEAVRELKLRDSLRTRAMRVSKLASRLDDTDFALGSDVMQVATQGYALLKVVGRAEGLDEARKELGARFAKTRRVRKEAKNAA